MKPVTAARRSLRGNWAKAVSVQCVSLCLGWLLSALEVLTLLTSGMGVQEVLHGDVLLQTPALWGHAALIGSMALLDWLLVSPFRVGQAAFFDCLAAGRSLPVRTVWRYYRWRSYRLAVRWQLALWIRRTLWGLLCYAPAACILGYGELLRRSGIHTPFYDVCRLFCTFFGLFALLAGWIVVQLIMLRYMPAQYLVAQGQDVSVSLKESRRLMRGHTGEMAWLYIGFSGWLAACVLVAPYFYVAPLFLTTRARAVRELRHAADAVSCVTPQASLRPQRA